MAASLVKILESRVKSYENPPTLLFEYKYVPPASTRPSILSPDPSRFSELHPRFVEISTAVRSKFQGSDSPREVVVPTRFRRPPSVNRPYFFRLSSGNGQAVWYLHSSFQDFLWNVETQTGKTLLTPPHITETSFRVDEDDTFSFQSRNGEAIRKFVKRILRKVSKRLKKMRKPSLFEWLIQSIIAQKIFPPVCEPTLFFYFSIFEDLRFLYGVSHLPVPNYDADLYFVPWVTACGYDYRSIWPILVHSEVSQSDFFDLFEQRSFIGMVIFVLFRRDEGFMNALRGFDPRTAFDVINFFITLPRATIGDLPRWSLSVILVELQRQFPDTDAVYYAIQNLLYTRLIRPFLAGCEEHNPGVVALVDSNFKIGNRMFGNDLRIAMEKFGDVTVNFDWHMKGLKMSDITTFVTYLFINPPALQTALTNSSLERDLDAFTAFLAENHADWP
jgi:hypothetical protein